MYFNEDELEFIRQVRKGCEEEFISMRKGVPQTKYIIHIPCEEVWCHRGEDLIQIPKHLIGVWREKWEGDNTQIDVEERLGIRDPYNFKTEWEKI